MRPGKDNLISGSSWIGWLQTRSGAEVPSRDCKLRILQDKHRSKTEKIFAYGHIAVVIGPPHWKVPSYIIVSLFVASDSLSLSSLPGLLIL